jgi:hypothetical protein
MQALYQLSYTPDWLIQTSYYSTLPLNSIKPQIIA